MSGPLDDEEPQRLFVAVRPPPSVMRSLSVLPRPKTPGVRWVDPAHWHLTLRFLPRSVPAEVAAALDHADLGPAVVTLGPTVTALGGRVVVIPADGLDDLAAAVLGVTRELGPVDRRPFRGHLTLARIRNEAGCGLVGEPYSADFVAEGVELVASEPDGGGVRHRTLATWPLGEPVD